MVKFNMGLTAIFETSGTAVKETTVELIYSSSEWIETVHTVMFLSDVNSMFITVLGVSQNGHVARGFPHEVQCRFGLILITCTPAGHRFNRNALFLKPISPVSTIAS